MIQSNAENILSIHITNNSSSESNDITTFVSLLKTCVAEANKPGFNNIFDDKQRRLINTLADDILPNKK